MALADTRISRGTFVQIEKIKDSAQKTVMHVAAQKGNAYAIQAMLDKGIPVDPRTQWKETPLHFAVRNNRLDCVNALLAGGASTSAETYGGDTPAQVAAKYKMAKISAVLDGK